LARPFLPARAAAPGLRPAKPKELRAMDELFRTIRVTVAGRVQGVGYRAFLMRAAARRQVCGWARNCADGSVEAVIGGAPDAIEALLRDMRAGPPHAQVTELRQHPADASALGEGFRILPDSR
jgi:acylphosphatase